MTHLLRPLAHAAHRATAEILRVADRIEGDERLPEEAIEALERANKALARLDRAVDPRELENAAFEAALMLELAADRLSETGWERPVASTMSTDRSTVA